MLHFLALNKFFSAIFAFSIAQRYVNNVLNQNQNNNTKTWKILIKQEKAAMLEENGLLDKV